MWSTWPGHSNLLPDSPRRRSSASDSPPAFSNRLTKPLAMRSNKRPHLLRRVCKSENDWRRGSASDTFGSRRSGGSKRTFRDESILPASCNNHGHGRRRLRVGGLKFGWAAFGKAPRDWQPHTCFRREHLCQRQVDRKQGRYRRCHAGPQHQCAWERRPAVMMREQQARLRTRSRSATLPWNGRQALDASVLRIELQLDAAAISPLVGARHLASIRGKTPRLGPGPVAPRRNPAVSIREPESVLRRNQTGSDGGV